MSTITVELKKSLLGSQIPPNPIFPVQWLQGPKMEFDFNEPQSHFFFGNPDTGKSTAMIAVMTNFLFNGHKAIDMAGAEAAAEELIWFFTKYAERTIMVHGDEMEVDSRFAHVSLSKFDFSVFKDHDIAVTTRGLYGDGPQGRMAYFNALFKIFSLCLTRKGWRRHGFGGDDQRARVIALGIREAWNIINSQIEAGISKDEQAAQRTLVWLNKERFHTGIAPLTDTQRYMEVQTSVRQLTNFRIIKGFGGQVIPDEFDFLFKPHLFGEFRILPNGMRIRKGLDENGPWKLRNLPPDEFIMLTSSNGVATGLVSKAPWNSHKGEYLIEELGIIVHPRRHEEPQDLQTPPPPVRKDVGTTSTDRRRAAMKQEHLEMLDLRNQGLTYEDITNRMNLPDRPMSEAKVDYHLRAKCACGIPSVVTAIA